jgi:aspartyl-tRNA synthetase
MQRKRSMGGLLFIDMRDHYGVTQVVLKGESDLAQELDALHPETVVSITGEVVKRAEGTNNISLMTGGVELRAESFVVLSKVESLPIPVVNRTEKGEPDTNEELRLKHRYLDIRKKRVHNNIVLRSNVIRSLRMRMEQQGFLEIQTPILTASSPEGARDYLVPSRLHPGKFYALPQAPQMFKQLLMVGGFDKYFQIAPCFRDEAGRSDRSPGEFYQLDFEMAFARQEDVFAAIEPVLHDTFVDFSGGRLVTPAPFARIPYREAVLSYGSDKPDLRNPLRITDLTGMFKDMPVAADIDETIFGINVPKVSRSVAKRLIGTLPVKSTDMTDVTVFWVKVKRPMDSKPLTPATEKALKALGEVRTALGTELAIIDENRFVFCWIVDFPMFEEDENGKIGFSHNPFSMPQGGMAALENQDPLEILAYQYDIVCNGVELSSGAIRNHVPEIMYKAFEIAGYSREDVDTQFAGMINAFKCGAPPHGGSAPGIDRIVMLLANEPNIREVIAFPMNQQAEDLMMGAPSFVSDKQLKELGIKPTKVRDES